MPSNRTRTIPRPLVFILACLVTVRAFPQDLKAMVSGGFANAYKQLVPQFEQIYHIKVETVWGPSMGTTPGAIPVRLAHGEAADLVVMVRSALDELANKGEVVKGSQIDLARSRIGLAVRKGAPLPDISSVAALRQALLNARSVAYSDSASGVYVANELFKRLGIAGEMAKKSRQIPAEPVGSVVARGDAEIGFQQMSELLPIEGITVVGPIPEEVQQVTIFSSGVVPTSKSRSSANSLIQYFASPGACEIIKKTGLDPIACTAQAK